MNFTGISSNTTGRYLILPRSLPMAVARIAAVIGDHRLAQGCSGRLGALAAAVARSFRGEARLVKEFIALKRPLLDPGLVLEAEGDLDPRQPRGCIFSTRIGPGDEGGGNGLIDELRPALAMILPGKE